MSTSMANCNCTGPVNGQPLCPCQMRAAASYFDTNTRHKEIAARTTN